MRPLRRAARRSPALRSEGPVCTREGVTNVTKYNHRISQVGRNLTRILESNPQLCTAPPEIQTPCLRALSKCFLNSGSLGLQPLL